MRINGFTQIKAFYSWTFSHQEMRIKPQHISLYLFLLNQNNRANWVEWFKCPFDLAMTGSCISSKKTYYTCLNELQDWKLIQYQKGSNNWKAPLIKLEVLKDTSTVPQSEPQLTPVSTPLPLPVPTHIYKLITDNKKLIIDNLEKWIKKEIGFNKEDDIKEKYSETEFIERWRNARQYYLKQPYYKTKLEILDKKKLDVISETYTKKQIDNAIKGIFSQKDVLKHLLLQPTHFLELKNFEMYLTCSVTGEQVYEKKGFKKPIERI